MPTLAPEKKNGGARKGSGAKKGVTPNAVIRRREAQGVLLADIEKQIHLRASKIIDAQYIAAMGTMQMCIPQKVNGKLEFTRVKDEKEMKRLLDEGDNGKDYVVFAGESPDWKAGESLLNRGFGKPTECVKVQTTVGIMHVIKLINSNDNSGDEDN
jgi:hypothetical protein